MDILSILADPRSRAVFGALVGGAPGMVAAVGTLVEAATAGADPSPDDLAAFEREADAAHAAVQNAS